LSGGGARGAYQIGALKALQELGILDKATAFSGASIGAGMPHL
jgi:NTE family protein